MNVMRTIINMLQTYNKEEIVNGVSVTKTYAPLSSLHNWDDNPKEIKSERFDLLKESLKKEGQLLPLLVDVRESTEGNLIGGNMTYRALSANGNQDAWIEPRAPRDDAHMFEIALKHNMMYGNYIEQKLQELANKFKDKVDLSKLFVPSAPEIDVKSLLAQVSPDVTEDEAPELQDAGISEVGKIYQLGRHRLMCGDSTVIENITTLINGMPVDMVLTDPPYGISIVSKNGGVGGGTEGKYAPVLGDDSTETAILAYDAVVALNIPKLIFWGGNYYATHLTDSSCWIVWDKQDGKTVTFADCELAWTNFTSPTRMYKHIWDGFRRDSEQGEMRVHPTQKPVKLMADIINDYEGTIILDLFGGSGSTLIASEQLGKTCLMMELDPRYCDVIRKRYSKLLGKEEEWQTLTPQLA